MSINIQQICALKDEYLSSQGYLTKSDLCEIYGRAKVTIRNYLSAAGLNTSKQSYESEEVERFHQVFQQVAIEGKKLSEVELPSDQSGNSTQVEQKGTASNFATDSQTDAISTIRSAVFGSFTGLITEEVKRFSNPEVLAPLISIVMAKELSQPSKQDLAEETSDFFMQCLQATGQEDTEVVLTAQLQDLGLVPELPSSDVLLLPAITSANRGSGRSSQDPSTQWSDQTAIDVYQS